MVKEKAYAKLNLFLNVVNKRFDGYHDLEMVMASIDLFDTLTFRPNKTGDISITSDTVITGDPLDNIVYQIATHMKKTYQINTGVDIHITKEIPIAAGLAGGSADGAATLRGLNTLWKLNLTLEELAEIGLSFGSDIPFCVYNKLCIARGRGEDLAFLDNKLNIPVLLVNPNIRMSTKEVFSHVKEEELTEHKISDMTNGIYNHNIPLIIRELHNSLEPIAFEMQPRIKEIKEQMINWGLEGALMSGSGATVFGLSTKKSQLKHVAEIFNDQYFVKLTKIR